MSSFNKLILMGNMVADPEFRRVGEKDLGRFTVAINDSYKGDAPPTYVDCEFWEPGKVATFLTKGKPVLLEGRIKQDRWKNSEGESRSKHIMVVQRLTLVGGKQSGAPNADVMDDFAA